MRRRPAAPAVDDVFAAADRIRNAPYPPPAHQTIITGSGPVDLGTLTSSTAGAFTVDDPPTVSRPVIAQEAPRLDVGPAVPPAGRRARRDPGTLRALATAAAAGAVVAGAFLAGQWTTQNGVRPVLPLPVAEVETAAGVARLWGLASPGERTEHCRLLVAPGETRSYAVSQWARHLRGPAGGRVDEVDPAVVARVLDDACAGRAPGG